jgi:hypothetical protein
MFSSRCFPIKTRSIPRQPLIGYSNILENDRMSFALPYPIFYLRSAIFFCDSATERIEFRADVADPIPQRFLQRPAELFRNAFDPD